MTSRTRLARLEIFRLRNYFPRRCSAVSVCQLACCAKATLLATSLHEPNVDSAPSTPSLFHRACWGIEMFGEIECSVRDAKCCLTSEHSSRTAHMHNQLNAMLATQCPGQSTVLRPRSTRQLPQHRHGDVVSRTKYVVTRVTIRACIHTANFMFKFTFSGACGSRPVLVYV